MWIFLALAIISLGLLVTTVTMAVRAASKEQRNKYIMRSVYCVICLVMFVIGGSVLHSRSSSEFKNDMMEDFGDDMYIGQQTGLASALAN